MNNELGELYKKITDASPEQILRKIREYGEGLDKASLRQKLRQFEGASIADLCQHLDTRNIGHIENVFPGRITSSLNFDTFERKGSSPLNLEPDAK